MPREQNAILKESRAKIYATYATFSLRDVLLFIFTRFLMCATFSKIFFSVGTF